MRGRIAFVACALVVAGGCTSLLGDFHVGDGGGPDSSLEGGPDAPPPDAPFDAPKDAPQDAPPPDGGNCGAKGQSCCNGVCNSGLDCCGPVCLDTSSDTKNCGSCGHACQGTGGCQGGLCQPETLTTTAAINSGRIRQDQADLVWINDSNSIGQAWSCKKTNDCSSPALLFTTAGKSFDMAYDPIALLVYMSDGSKTLYACPITGCGQIAGTRTITTVQNGFDGLDARGDVYASLDVQPYELAPDGGLTNLGGGNEGTNSVVAPPQMAYVFWPGFRNIRWGKAASPGSAATFWSSTANENTYLIAADANFVVWTADPGSGITIYACAAQTFPCTSPTTLATGQNVGSREGALAIDPNSEDVFWIGTDSSFSHVQVHSCNAKGCNQNPTLVASVSATVPGAVAADPQFVYFDYDMNGTTSVLARVSR